MTWKSYLIAQAFGVAAFNAACNAAYTWFLWRDENLLSYDVIGADLALTPAWIGLLSVLLGTPFIRKALANSGMVREVEVVAPRFARLIPRNVLMRSIGAAALCAMLFALPLTMILPMIGDGLFTPADAIATKVAITVACSLIIVPLVVIATTVDAPGSTAQLRKRRG